MEVLSKRDCCARRGPKWDSSEEGAHWLPGRLLSDAEADDYKLVQKHTASLSAASYYK